jgi:hypothetical protein
LFVDLTLVEITPDQCAVARQWRAITTRTRDGNVDDLAGTQAAMTASPRIASRAKSRRIAMRPPGR